MADDGLIFQFEEAKRQIRRLRCDNIVLFPGNHDYRHTGYLLFRKFFPNASIGKSKVYEFNEGKQQKVVLSIVGTARADRDEGEVGIRQNLWLNKTLKKYNNKSNENNKDDSDFIQIKKIVAMHHHLIAIHDTGYTNIGVSDAGDVLRTCLANNVDLIICGHKYRPWLWDFGTMKIAYAGTSCSWRYRGIFEDTFNIIDIKDDKIHIDIKIVGGERMPLSEVVKKYDPEDRVTKIAEIMPHRKYK